MHLITYILTIAESKEDAENNVRGFVEDRIGERNIFDYGDVDEEKDVCLLSEVREQLITWMKEPEAELSRALSDFDTYRTMGEGYRGSMGWNACRIGEILTQDFTDVMPFYNMEECDWSLPEHDEDGVAKAMAAREMDADRSIKWYAVPVDLHF